MKKIFKLYLAALLSCGALSAKEPYQTKITVDATSKTIGAPNLVDLNRSLRSSSLEEAFPTYTPVSPISFDINLRGLRANTSFAANSTALVIQIPNAGITEVIDGGSRDASLSLFKEYVRDGGAGHSALFRAYAKFSPIDPIAGNPNSLMAQMGASDYNMARLSPFSGCDCWEIQPKVHQFQLGLNVGRSFSHGFDTTLVSLPLRYSYLFNLGFQHPWALIIDAPITYLRNGGASSVVGSVATGLHVPLTKSWSITSSTRLGFGGTLDLCTSGSFFSPTLTSLYEMKFLDGVLAITNSCSYYISTNFWLTGINFDYHLHNFVYKNGLSLTSCEGYNFCNRPINFSISFVDTYFDTNKLYIRHYDEIGASVLVSYLNPYLNYDCLSLGLVYQFGEKHYRGCQVNLNYQF